MIRPHPQRKEWFQIDPMTAQVVANLPGIQWDGSSGLYRIHRSHLPLIDDPEARKLLEIKATSSVWEARDARTEPLGFKLRTTQQQAIDFIEPRRGALIGDDPRLGKTLSALMAHDPRRGSFVVVAPLSTRAVWLGWMRRAFPEYADQIGVITGRKFDADVIRKPFVFGHYDVIHRWQSLSARIGTLVFDEAHQLVNREARRAIAAGLLQMNAEKVIPMTGTPIWNLPPDLWAVLGLVAPGAWGSYYDFSNRYGAPVSTAHGVKYTGASNQEELNARLSEVMIRRRWVDVAEDLPPITRSVIVAEVTDAGRNKLDILAAKLRSEKTNTAGNLAAYRRQVTIFKEKTVFHEASKITSRGEPVVVWTWHKDYADRLHNMMNGQFDKPVSFLIHGDISPAKRDEIMDAWKRHPNAVLIATMPVAQVGIDLSHARVAIFAEIDYTPAILGQAEMRTFSPLRPMDIIFVVANHIVDQRIVRALVHKLSAANPFGVGAAVDAIDALREAIMGPEEVGDMDRLMADFLASAA